MEKKRKIGKLQFASSSGNFHAARLEGDRVHVTKKTVGTEYDCCKWCYQPINSSWSEQVEVVSVYTIIKSGDMRLPVHITWHKECAEKANLDFS